jgi:hypothetical protein
MKVYLVVSVVLWAMLAGHTSQICSVNPFLKERTSYSDVPLVMLQTKISLADDRYAKLRGKCGNEWDRHGLCCSPWDIEAHLNRDQILLLKTSQQFAQFYSKLNGSLKSTLIALKKLALASPHPYHPEWATNINFAKSFLSKGENLYNFERYSTIGSDKMTEVYKTEMQKCWSSMAALRRGRFVPLVPEGAQSSSRTAKERCRMPSAKSRLTTASNNPKPPTRRWRLRNQIISEYFTNYFLLIIFVDYINSIIIIIIIIINNKCYQGCRRMNSSLDGASLT